MPPAIPTVNEQRDAAEFFEKILGLTSRTASEVKTSPISKRICMSNEKYLLNSLCNFVLSDLPWTADT